MLNKKHLFI